MYLSESSPKDAEELRAMDAVFPVREKAVNRINYLSESSLKNAEELRYIDAVRTK